MMKPMAETTWAHDALMMDLAGHLRRGSDRMVWTDMQLGPSGSPRPDVYTIDKSYSRPQPTAFEIKVSRSDLRSDTTSGKWQSYLRYAGSVTFAVPEGLCTPADIPTGCGMIVRKAETWRYARRPTVQQCALPMPAVMKLLIDGISRVEHLRDAQPRRLELWKSQETIRKKFGDTVAEAARDLASVQDRIANAKAHESAEYERIRKEVEARRVYLLDQAKKEMAEFEAAKADLRDWLELAPDASSHAVRRAIQKLKASCDVDQRVATAEVRLAQARRTLRQALDSIEPQTAAAA